MRFVFVSTMDGFPWGGSEELWSRAAVRLAAAGHEVSASVLYWKIPSLRVLALRDRGVDLQMRKPPSYSLARRVWRKVTNTQSRRKDLEWLKKQNADLVVISQGGATDGHEWFTYCSEQQIPFVVVIQANHIGYWPTDGVRSRFVQALDSARAIYCVSQHNLALLRDQLVSPLKNGRVICNPFNVAITQPPDWPSSNGVFRAACVARMDPRAKGQDLLLHVFQRARWKQRPIELRFYGAGPMENGIRELAARLGVAQAHFCGHVENVTDIWKTNQLLVLPSRYEGTPLALLEAMWCARPAVVTDVGGNAELCLDGKTGFVAASPTVDMLDSALERAWAHRDVWEEMGKAARRRCELMVPEDPVREFCGELVQCVATDTAVSRYDGEWGSKVPNSVKPVVGLEATAIEIS
jgi:glycosyltransferase involved in cell wall biosynthesis